MLRIPLTGLTAASKQLSAISNNLANANTIGFKKSSAEFGDIMAADAATTLNSEIGKGVSTINMKRDIEQGTLQQTSSSLDVALQGDGYLVFGTSTSAQTSGGETYSRAGNLTVDVNGYLVDDSGAPVMGNQAIAGTTLQSPNMQPINIFKAVGNNPANVGSISIDSQGLISVVPSSGGDPVKVAYLSVARFENENGMQALGGNKFSASQDSGVAQYGRGGADGFGAFAQGNLENSNVDITNELVQMIAAQQAYNGNSRALQTGSDMLRSLTEQAS
jgi:flagellar hook protein FlgE